jgi:hypothetical protein
VRQGDAIAAGPARRQIIGNSGRVTVPGIGGDGDSYDARKNHSLIWRQEFEAEFTSLDPSTLTDVTKLLQPSGDGRNRDTSMACS